MNNKNINAAITIIGNLVGLATTLYSFDCITSNFKKVEERKATERDEVDENYLRGLITEPAKPVVNYRTSPETCKAYMLSQFETDELIELYKICNEYYNIKSNDDKVRFTRSIQRNASAIEANMDTLEMMFDLTKKYECFSYVSAIIKLYFKRAAELRRTENKVKRGDRKDAVEPATSKDKGSRNNNLTEW